MYVVATPTRGMMCELVSRRCLHWGQASGSTPHVVGKAECAVETNVSWYSRKYSNRHICMRKSSHPHFTINSKLETRNKQTWEALPHRHRLMCLRYNVVRL